jgi:hypothetical protein
MGEIINLRLSRKRIARAEKEAKASENRTKHGQPKASKTLIQKINALETKRLDQTKRDDKTKQ